MDKVIDLSTPTERIIKKAVVRQKKAGGFSQGARGDLALICVDAKADTWVFFEISDVDDHGEVLAVWTPAEGRVAVRALNDRSETILLSRERIKPGAVAALGMTEFDGLAQAQAAASEWRTEGVE